MQKLNILNTREIKKIREIVVRDYGTFFTKEYAFLRSDKGRIYLISKDLVKIDLRKLRVDKLGLYLAEEKKNQIRLSKEGAQLLFKESGSKIKNQIELNESEMGLYFKGLDLHKDLGKESKFLLLKYKKNVLGCAKYKDKKILNYLPKIHRGVVIL
jgi:NOL1/NOP2/fmu family ribosome biogenesis protein